MHFILILNQTQKTFFVDFNGFLFILAHLITYLHTTCTKVIRIYSFYMILTHFIVFLTRLVKSVMLLFL